MQKVEMLEHILATVKTSLAAAETFQRKTDWNGIL